MTFKIEFTIRTTPKNTRAHAVIEEFEVDVEANSFGEAKERVFKALKASPSIEAFMDTLVVPPSV